MIKKCYTKKFILFLFTDSSLELCSRLESRDLVRRNSHTRLLQDITSHLGSTRLGDKTTETTDIDILSVDQIILYTFRESLNNHTDRFLIITGACCQFINNVSFSHISILFYI